jgi:hypothetical protein
MKILSFIFFVLCVLFPTQSKADLSDWSETDKHLLLASEISLYLDWRQTLDIKSHSNFYETNPILGQHPSNSRVDIYFGSVMAGTYVIANQLDENRSLFLGGITLVEVFTILKNRRLGLSFSF